MSRFVVLSSCRTHKAHDSFAHIAWAIGLSLLVVGCSAIRDPDDFTVGDAGPSDAAADGSTDAPADGSADAARDAFVDAGCMNNDECAALPNAMPMCTAGNCVLGTCADGFADCDGEQANGCEQGILENGNCGACGVTCSDGTPFCEVSDTSATCVATCDQTECGADCVDTTTNVMHCGGCDMVCSVPDGALMATCAASECGYECNVGRDDCDGDAANGCEVMLAADPMNCGSCGMMCTLGPNATDVSCDSNVCTIGTCADGFADCDGDAENGCEADLNAPETCGACDNVCGAGISCLSQTCDAYVKVDTLFDHTCALRESGAVDCWGENNSRQYVGPDPRPSEAPLRVQWQPGGVMQDFLAKDISVGIGTVCFVSRDDTDDAQDGVLYCQGTNSETRGGRSSGPSSPAQPVEFAGGVTPPKFVAVESRNFHSCALDEDANIWCWGNSSSDQTGPDPLGSRLAQEVPLPPVVQVAPSNTATCALLVDGTVQCFGGNHLGQLGRGTIVPLGTETFGTPAPVVGVGGAGVLSGATAIAAGTDEFCAIHGAANDLSCWGWNVGQSVQASGVAPAPVTIATGVQEVMMFHFAICWNDSAGEMSCRGRRNENQFGAGPITSNATSATRVSGLDGLSGIDGGYRGGCALRGGEALCWGYSGWGTIPRDTLIEEVAAPIVDDTGTPITDLTGVVSNAEGSCGIRDDGATRRAYCWGAGGRSESGTGNNLSSGVPKQVNLLVDVVAIARGDTGVCAIEDAGAANELRCWSLDRNGAIGGIGNQSMPALVPGVTDPVAIDMGDQHGCVLLRDESVMCWGYNNRGQTGATGATAPPTTVVREVSPGVTEPIRASAITTGFDFSCAVLSGTDAGQVWCWGGNAAGQLGRGATSTSEGVGASMVVDAVSIEAGLSHVCAVSSAGGIACWGSNEYGQLGNGTSTTTTDIVNVVDLGVAAVSVAANARSTCAAYADRTVRCWGNNTMSQLGVAGAGHRAPQLVPGVSADIVSNASNTGFFNCAGDDVGSWSCWGLNSFGKLGTTPELYFAPTQIDRSLP